MAALCFCNRLTIRYARQELEPVTYSSGGYRSIQLSYGRVLGDSSSYAGVSGGENTDRGYLGT